MFHGRSSPVTTKQPFSFLKLKKPIPTGTHIIGSAYIQYTLRITWVANCRCSDWEWEYWWVWVRSITCEVPPCVLATCAWFSLGFDSFLSLIHKQSTFQCHNFAEGILVLLQSLKSTLDFDFPRSHLPFQLALLPLTVNIFADLQLENSLSFCNILISN